MDRHVLNFNTKIYYLETFVRKNGHLDCLLFGSSHVNSGLDPRIVNDVYEKNTGYQTHCFNFGISSLTADTAGPLLSALVEKFHPNLVVFEVSARSFDSYFGEQSRPLINNKWIQYQNGDWSLDGWALDDLYGYRYFLTLKAWELPQNRKALTKNWIGMNIDGYSPVSADESLDNPSVQEIDFEIDSSYWNGFLQALSLQTETKIVVLESPIKESYMPDYLKGGISVYENEFIFPVESELAKSNILFWRAVEDVSPLLSDDMWFDPRHVNVKGAEIFSTWLGEQMSTQIPPSIFK